MGEHLPSAACLHGDARPRVVQQLLDGSDKCRASISSPALIPTSFTDTVDVALNGVSQFIETIIKTQRQISCHQRLKLSGQLPHEFAWSRAWSASGSSAAKLTEGSKVIVDISDHIAVNRAYAVHCDPVAEEELRASLEAFDPVSVIEAARNSVHKGPGMTNAVSEILQRSELAIAAGFDDLARKWLESLRRHQELKDDRALALRFFPLQIQVAQSADEIDAAMGAFLAFSAGALPKPDPERFSDFFEAAIELMIKAGMADKALHWLEEAAVHRSYNYRVSMDVEPRSAEAFERASLERKLIADGSLSEADYARLHRLRLARIAPDPSDMDDLPLDLVKGLSERLPARTGVVRFYVSNRLAVAFVG